MTDALITIAICTYNRHELLKDMLKSVVSQNIEREKYKVLVVDNSSDKKRAEEFYKEANLDSSIQVIWSFPPGVSHARNTAVTYCNTPYIAFLDDDSIPDPDWLSAILDGFKNDGRVVVVGGPVYPIWPTVKPAWLPDEYLGYLSALDLGDKDRILQKHESVYGNNIAFNVRALRECGGFPEQLGRKGNASLLSGEETHVQDVLRSMGYEVFYKERAKVHHHVHQNRLSRNWLRSRVAWQRVSEMLQDPPQFVWDWAFSGLQRLTAEDSTIAVAISALLRPVEGRSLAIQLETIQQLIGILLAAHDVKDSVMDVLLNVQDAINGSDKDRILPGNEGYAPSAPLAIDTRYLFVEGVPGHRYLYDLYGELSNTQLVTYEVENAWSDNAGAADTLEKELAFIQRSIHGPIKTVFYLSFDPLLYSPQREKCLRFLAAAPVKVYGILHRMPQQPDQIRDVQRLGHIVDGICFLSETMAEQARSIYGIRNVLYLPHHPTMYLYPQAKCLRENIRNSLGVLEHQVVFSVIGEARHGKGIDLLLAALEHIPTKIRDQFFFLFAGKARHYSREDIQTGLIAARVSGSVDLRLSPKESCYSVLTDREYAQYIFASDVGLLLYENDQRDCMSGALGDYIWADKPVLATGSSYVGAEVQRHSLGLTLHSESPVNVAAGLIEILHLVQSHAEATPRFHAYRDRIAPNAVLQCLLTILDHEHE
jgi:GT2 family glycosyltransferase